MAAIQQADKPFSRGVGAKCKKCQFRLPADPGEAAGLRAREVKSGFDECWAKAVGGAYDPADPKVIELWNLEARSRERDEACWPAISPDAGNYRVPMRAGIRAETLVSDDRPRGRRSSQDGRT